MNLLVLIFAVNIFTVLGYPEQGVWDLETKPGHEYVGVKKSIFKGTHINIKVMCNPDVALSNTNIEISWMLWKTPCWNEYIFQEENKETSLEVYFEKVGPKVAELDDNSKTGYIKTGPVVKPCDNNILLDEVNLESMIIDKKSESLKERTDVPRAADPDGDITDEKVDTTPETPKDQGISENHISSLGAAQTKHPVAVIPTDGVYFLVVHTAGVDGGTYRADIHIEIKSQYGYLSAVDWPLLGFYAAMCVVYLIYGLAWLVVSFMRWRELLRVQYWIGAVILLGMLEKAVFTAEYSSINQRGYSIPGLIVFAELVSCAKRTLARMLVIIVSLGFGIVKPRLGVILHRVVGVGLLYFILASIEGCTRALQSRNDPQRQVLLASLPLSLLESAICFWIFTALVQTTRTLRLRRNLVKLSLYRHFTNTLAFGVIASVIFMLWSIRYHQFEDCVTDWKEIWVDDAYWHVLFAIILLVIMILWRPSNNNQRFAFSPLLDDGSDADDEEESEKLMADVSDTMKLRNTRNSTSSSPRESRTVEDDLKWVEENIPSSIADSALPILDSDEEIVTSTFEISKMQ
ncbi:Transmembrane protein 87A [Halocaridina rubra]|uniref:Transmembrane protein 87A n=1 Tax=Halocaridina rubra TaxID=373956 RepID=A0AAN9A1F1_HALRR